jgi:hypothetical protein
MFAEQRFDARRGAISRGPGRRRLKRHFLGLHNS